MSETSPLENKVVEVLDASQKAIGAFADKLGDLAQQYGPEVADAALQTARIDAASQLIPAIVWIIGTIFVAPKYFAWAKAAIKRDHAAEMVALIATSVTGGLTVVVANAAALLTILDIWRWVGIFEPKLWLAKRILGL